jgi:predicted nucleic acid-binding protein
VPRGAAEIRAAIAADWLKVWQTPVPEIDLPDLDEGGPACIRIAIAHQARPDHEALLLMDERAGRAVAAEHKLRVAGTAAIIGMAKKVRVISSARHAFETLHASDFRISAEVIRTVLAAVGET